MGQDYFGDLSPIQKVIIIPIAIFFIVLVFVFVVPAFPRPSTPSGWPGSAAPTAPPSLIGQVPPVGQVALTLDEGLFPGEAQQIQAELERALRYVAERVGYGPASSLTAAFTTEANCNLHGVALTEQRVAQVYTCNELGRARSMSIMAHEMVHVLAADRYGAYAKGGDLILVEGLATYGAGTYWFGEQPDFRAYVRAQRASGVVYALTDNFRGVDVEAMNVSYYQWASFVEFLRTIGTPEQFDALYVTGTGEPGTADYLSVYGKSFPQLAEAWQVWVDQ